MAAEEVLELFDSYWFERDIFAANQMFSASTEKLIHQKPDDQKLYHNAKLQGRSLSDQCLRYETSLIPKDSSPKSVITTPKLQKIYSGKEMCEFFSNEEEVDNKLTHTPVEKKLSLKKRRKGVSRSLSDLEFEELKGFMDLGFVFTEEGRTSRLVSIIPGLQRWDQDDYGGEDKCDECCKTSRPYLSEAWEVLDQRKASRQLMKWRIPALANENNLKDHLRAWAHTVASTIR